VQTTHVYEDQLQEHLRVIKETKAESTRQSQLRESLELKLKDTQADLQHSDKQVGQLESQLQESTERNASLKKHSQQLQMQMDNLKITKEQQFLQLN
jgi:peptidoglycan hydrolase CwlO-like protein